MTVNTCTLPTIINLDCRLYRTPYLLMSHVLRVVNPYFPERGFAISEIVEHLNRYVSNHAQYLTINLLYANSIRHHEQLEIIQQSLDHTFIELVLEHNHAINPLAVKFLPIKERLLYQAICEYCIPLNKLTCLSSEIYESYRHLISLNDLKTSRVSFHNYLHNLEKVGLIGLKNICYTTSTPDRFWVDDIRNQNHRVREITLIH